MLLHQLSYASQLYGQKATRSMVELVDTYALGAYASKHPFEISSPKLDKLKNISPSDKQKCQLKVQHEFIIKGVKIMAASKEDAIKKYNHRKK